MGRAQRDRATPRPVANRPAQPSPGRNVYAMAAPAGAPRRRRVHPGMHSSPTRAARLMERAGEGRVCHGCALTAQAPAPRSAAERWRRSGEGAPWHALAPRALARGRGPAEPGRGRAQTATATHAHRPIPPSCVTTATASLWVRHRRTAHPSACPIPSRFSPTVGIATKSPLCIHTSPHFSASFRRRPLGPPAPPPRSSSFAVIGARRAPHAAVRRRQAEGRYSSGHPSRPALLKGRSGPRALLTPLQAHKGSQGSFRFLRVLPGSSPAVPTGM